MAGPQHGLGTEAGWRVLPGALGRLSPSIRKHGAPCLRSQSGKRRCRVPTRPARGSGVRSSPAGMREGVSSATPRPAAHESRASTRSRRPGLAPRPPILPCAREPGRPAVATSRETRRPRSALGQTRARGGGRRRRW